MVKKDFEENLIQTLEELRRSIQKLRELNTRFIEVLKKRFEEGEGLTEKCKPMLDLKVQIDAIKRIFKSLNTDVDIGKINWKDQVDEIFTLSENRKFLSKIYPTYKLFKDETEAERVFIEASDNLMRRIKGMAGYGNYDKLITLMNYIISELQRIVKKLEKEIEQDKIKIKEMERELIKKIDDMIRKIKEAKKRDAE